MTKFNYNEPEFKVVKALSEDVMTTSLDRVSNLWNVDGSNSGDSVTAGDVDFVVG